MPRSVVVVEDDAMLRRVIVRSLAGQGHSVREASTADEAVAALLVEQPDILLLDINLPDRTGWDVLRELKAHGVEAPTIVVSAVRVSPSRLAEFRPMGFLPKPFPIEALLRLVAGKRATAGDDEGSAESGE